jgi:hypothetical protein
VSIAVRWENPEKNILILTFKGSWTKYELNATTEKALALLKSVPPPVTVVFDFRFMSWIVFDPSFLLLNFSRLPPPCIQQVILLGVSQTFFSTFSRVYNAALGPGVFCAASMHEARQMMMSQQREAITTVQNGSQQAVQPGTHPVLQSFETRHALMLTSFKGNGLPASTVMPFILNTGCFYVLIRSDALEIIRVRNNPYVYIQEPSMHDPLKSSPSGMPIQATASVLSVSIRPDLIEDWRRKYPAGTFEDNWLEIVPSALA